MTGAARGPRAEPATPYPESALKSVVFRVSSAHRFYGAATARERARDGVRQFGDSRLNGPSVPAADAAAGPNGPTLSHLNAK